MIPHPNTNGNVAVCHRCKFSQSNREGGCSGPCVCHVNGKDIITNAREGNCPEDLFPKLDQAARSRLILSHALPPPMPIPDDFDPEQERRRMQQGGCCGSPSA